MSLQYGGVLRTPSVGDSTPNARLLIESDHNRVSGSGDLGVFGEDAPARSVSGFVCWTRPTLGLYYIEASWLDMLIHSP